MSSRLNEVHGGIPFHQRERPNIKYLKLKAKGLEVERSQSRAGQGGNLLDFIARCYYSLIMLTNNDLTKIKLLVTSGNSQVLKEIDEVKEKIENVESQVKLIPSKGEFFGAMSELMGEVKSSREEQTAISGRLSESHDRLDQHETRLSGLEKKATFSPPPT